MIHSDATTDRSGQRYAVARTAGRYLLLAALALLVLGMAHYALDAGPERLSGAAFVRRHLAPYTLLLIAMGMLAVVAARLMHARSAAGERTPAVEEQCLLLSRAVEQSATSVMITDAEGIIEYVNPRFTELTGYSLDEVRGRNPRMLRSGATPRALYAGLWRTITAGGEWRGIIQNRKKSGELFWEAATISGIRDAAGAVSHFLAVKDDITDRKHLEERLYHCVESAPNAVLLTEAGGRIILVNAEAERLFGYRRDDLLGKDMEILLPAADRNKHRELRAAYCRAPATRTVGKGRELFARHKDGHRIPVEIGLSPIDADEGQLVMAAIIDLTERRQLEKALRERDEEVTRTKALAAIGRMANMVAHDIRNPLSSIKMALQIMGKRHAAQASHDALELKDIALAQVRYMEEIIDDLLSYSRENSLTFQWLKIDEVLDAAVLLSQKYIEEHLVRVAKRYQPGLPMVHGDANRLRRAFSNLILNAAQSTHDIAGTRAEISISAQLELAPDHPKIRVVINDNGCGISAETDQLFEPFYTTRASGTGLGLPIVKRIIEEHRADIALLPGEITGTSAVVILPTDAATDCSPAPTTSVPGVGRESTGEQMMT